MNEDPTTARPRSGPPPPRVSVCIPTYNQGLYLREAVESVIRQTSPVREVIISDDASTDDTGEVAAELARAYPEVRVISQPANLGIAKNTDACLRAATGAYVVRLDSDDRLLPGYVTAMTRLLDAHPSAGYAHANVRQIDQDGEYTRDRTLHRADGLEDATTALRLAPKGYRVAANILTFRREALAAVDYVAGLPNFGEDYYLSVRLAEVGFGNAFTSEFLAEYRVWTGERQVRSRRALMEIEGVARIYDEVLEPLFAERFGDASPVERARARFAADHSSALDKPYYSAEERATLKRALLEVSDAPEVRRAIRLRERGLGNLLDARTRVFTRARALAKRVLRP